MFPSVALFPEFPTTFSLFLFIHHLPINHNILTYLPHQADDELETPVLAGFEWDKEESWTRLIVHCKKEGAPQPKKKSKKAGKEGEEL